MEADDGDYTGQRHSPLTQINTSNVASLNQPGSSKRM
jgi:glucose dehydrogenase